MFSFYFIYDASRKSPRDAAVTMNQPTDALGKNCDSTSTVTIILNWDTQHICYTLPNKSKQRMQKISALQKGLIIPLPNTAVERTGVKEKSYIHTDVPVGTKKLHMIIYHDTIFPLNPNGKYKHYHMILLQRSQFLHYILPGMQSSKRRFLQAWNLPKCMTYTHN